jgi:glucan phosphorylase
LNFLTEEGTPEAPGIMASFKAFLPSSTFFVIANGVNPRKYLHIANGRLTKLLSDEIGDDETEWLTQMILLKQLLHKVEE